MLIKKISKVKFETKNKMFPRNFDENFGMFFKKTSNNADSRLSVSYWRQTRYTLAYNDGKEIFNLKQVEKFEEVFKLFKIV